MKDRVTSYLEGVNRHVFLFRASALAVNKCIAENMPNPKLRQISVEQIKAHDLSKFDEPELSGYSNYFPEKREQYKPAFLQAVQHHYAHNPHHPEFWMMRQSSMPENYISEMVADWMAASYQYSGTWNMSDWLNKQFLVDGQLHNIFNNEQMQYLIFLLLVCGYTFSIWAYNNSPSDIVKPKDNYLRPDISC
jgi:hypothetical protein